MIKFNTVGMIQTSQNNPTLRLDYDVWNDSLITVDDNLYLVSNNATGDNNAEHDVLIPAGEPLNCYLIKAFEGQELIVDYNNLEDSSSTLSVGDILVIGDNNKLKPGTASGIFFVVTKTNAFLTEQAVAVRVVTVAEPSGGGIPSNAIVIDGATDIKLSLFNDDLGITSVVVPGTVENVRGFANCKNLKSVNIKSGVQSIEPEAFSGCTSLIDLALEDGLVKIAEAAFAFCISLRNLSTDAKTICSHAFEGCEGLKKIELREGVEELSGSPFIGVNLDSPLILPNSMKLIEELAFEEMYGDIYCRFSADSPAAANAPWGATGNVVFNYTGD